MIPRIRAPPTWRFPDYSAALTGDVKGLVIGVPEKLAGRMKHRRRAATMAAFEAALDVFRGLGASVRPVTLPPLQQFDDSKKTHRGRRAVHHPRRGSAHAAGAVRRQPALPDHRRRPGARRGLYPGDALAHRPGARHAGRPVDGRSADAADQRAGREARAGAAVEPVHAGIVHHAVQCRRQSGLVGVQRLRRATACRFRCRSSAGCSTRRRCCAPATPTKRRRRGAASVRHCSRCAAGSATGDWLQCGRVRGRCRIIESSLLLVAQRGVEIRGTGRTHVFGCPNHSIEPHLPLHR